MSVKDILSDPNKVKKLTEAAFKAVDSDNSGYLEKNELEIVMTNVANDIGVNFILFIFFIFSKFQKIYSNIYKFIFLISITVKTLIERRQKNDFIFEFLIISIIQVKS
jgi:Ca2+-binding EF-hand superfamily protein